MGIPRRGCLVALLAVIAASTRSEKCNSALEGQLLVAQEGTIWQVNPRDHHSRQPLALAESATKLAYSYARSTLYYSEVSSRQVYALEDGAESARVVLARQGEWLPWGLAVDDLNDKLYVLESLAGALHAYDLASGASSLVIGTNISEPKDLELDADAGYLFVLDKYQILRAELDGSNARPIYQERTSIDELLQDLHYLGDLTDAIIDSLQPAPDRKKLERKPIGIADLTLDPKARRLYWLDSRKRSLESSDYLGQRRRVHLRETSLYSLASLALSSGSLYWADDVARKVFKIGSGNRATVLMDAIESQAIAAIDCERRPTSPVNPCAGNGCQQMCLPSKSSPRGYACACHVGHELAFDGETCDSVRDFLLFTQDSYLRGQSLSEGHKDVIEPWRLDVGKAAFVDVDVSRGKVYYSALFPNDKLHEIDLTSREKRVLSPDLLSKSTGDLAYDWTTGNLYYFSYYYADATTLSVTNVRDPSYSKLLVKNVPRLARGLVLHPNRGLVFFARLDERRQRASISRLASDGSGLRVILELPRVESVDALALDYRADRIYWTETRKGASTRVVRHANLDGQDVRTLNLAGDSLKSASELVIDGDYIYGISDGQLLFRVDPSGREPANLVQAQLPDSLSDLKIFSRSRQSTRPDHPCKSHGCRKFCFAVPSSGGELVATCACPYGAKLAHDGLSCVDNSQREPPFLACKSSSFKCNMRTG